MAEDKKIDLGTNIAAAVSPLLSDSKPEAPVVAPQILIPGQYSGRQVEKDYNEINYLEMESVKQAKLESWMAQAVGRALMDSYPGRQWGVGVDIGGGMIHVMCPSVSTEKAYYISMEGRTLADLVAKAKWAAGEILERYNLSRGRKFDPDTIETLARDARDEVISDDAAPEPIHKCPIH